VPAFGPGTGLLDSSLLGGIQERVSENIRFDFALDQVVSSAFLSRPIPHRRIFKSRQDNHRHPQGLLVDFEERAQARGIVQKQVEKDDVEFFPGEPSQAFVEMLNMDELELGSSDFSESFLNQPRVAGVIFHEQHPDRSSPYGGHASLAMSPAEGSWTTFDQKYWIDFITLTNCSSPPGFVI